MKLENLLPWLRGESTEPAAAVVSGNIDDIGEILNEFRRENAKLRTDAEWESNRFRLEIEGLRGDIVELRAQAVEKSAEIKGLQGDLVKAEASADERARALVRKAGHDPVQLDQPGPPHEDPVDSIVVAYKQLPAGPERSEFRNKNRAALEKHFGPGLLKPQN